jgi:hypothetical protein
MTATRVQQFVALVDERSGTPARRSHGDGYQCHCPAHDDSQASLSVRGGMDGRVLIHCHAGCSPESIVAALGLHMRDLMPPDPGSGVPGLPTASLRTSRVSVLAHLARQPASGGSAGQRSYASEQAAIAALSTTCGQPSHVYRYNDSNGAVIGSVLRWEAATFDGGSRRKRFVPIKQEGNVWSVGAPPAPRPLFNLPRIIESDLATDRVYFVEGEKCVELLAEAGLVATTTMGGSSAPQLTDLGPLAGRNIVLVPDNDDAGCKYAQAILSRLFALSPTPIVRVVELPDLPPKGDAVDFQANRSLSPPALAAELERLAVACVPLASPPPLESTPIMNQSSNNTADHLTVEVKPVVESLGARPRRAISWLWPGRIPFGKITLLAGDPGLGKSVLMLDVAARLSRGLPMPTTPGEPHERPLPPEPASTLLLSAEDDLDDTIAPRFVAAGGALDRLRALSGVYWREGLARTRQTGHFQLDRHLEALAAAIGELDRCRLVVIDPVSAYLGRLDTHRNSEVRNVLAPLGELAAETGVAVVLVTHLNKQTQGPTIYRSMGSLAFAAVARSVLSVVQDPHTNDGRVCAPVKSNLGPAVPPIAYRVVADSVNGSTESADGAPHVVWDEERLIPFSIDWLVADNEQAAQGSTSVSEAAEWLREALAGGPRPSADLKADAEAAGIASRTLWRAKAALRVLARQVKNGDSHHHLWEMPT